MGREATCTCVWNGKKSIVKALIEPPELILRGELKRRVPIATMKSVKAERDQLCFTVEGDPVALSLGSDIAVKWADALLKPPPTLARKLGITRDTTVWMIGRVDDAALDVALAEAKAVSTRKGDLILARVDTPAELQSALIRATDQLKAGTPIWFIYPKHSGRKGTVHPLSENFVRTTALATGIVDTKVASVSAALTALRFTKRRS
ncbi:MAG TPA: hypothetical protein VL135_06255 [Terracidiphilus sp.]|jgi:hypothetical protein|nr:hypothetical protein [Terracidiphilus sp.]